MVRKVNAGCKAGSYNLPGELYNIHPAQEAVVQRARGKGAVPAAPNTSG